MTNREFFACRWQAEYSAFVSVMRALAKDRLDYRPHQQSPSAAELVWILVRDARLASELVDAGEIRWVEIPPRANLDEMICAYQRHHAALAYRLEKLDDMGWEQPGKLFADGRLIVESTLGGLLWLLLFDGIHHRGQLTAYITPMGGKMLSLYRASAANHDDRLEEG